MTSLARSALLVLYAACQSATAAHGTTPLANASIPASPSAEKLLAAVDDVATAADRTDHARVHTALAALADALTDIAPHRTTEILRVRTSGAALLRSTGNARADFARIALNAAANAFGAIGPRGDRARYGDALVALTQAIAAIDPERTLADEYPRVTASLRAAVRVVYAADNAAVPPLAGERVAER